MNFPLASSTPADLGFAPEPLEPVFASTMTLPVSNPLFTIGATAKSVAVAKQPGFAMYWASAIASRFVSVRP